MIYEKYPLGERPFINAEIPYGFKQTWLIDLSVSTVGITSFTRADINSILLNGNPVTVDQMIYLYDYTRDLTGLTTNGDNSIIAIITSVDSTKQVFTFTEIAEQNLSFVGVLGITGDMVDNTDPLNPVIKHDDQKLDVTTYAADQQLLEARLGEDEQDIADLQSQVGDLQTNGLTGVDWNGTPVPVVNNHAQITNDSPTAQQFQDALDLKVDKAIAQSVVSDSSSTLTPAGVLETTTTKRDLSTGTETPTTQSIDLRTGLGLDTLEALDFQYAYYFNSDNITSFDTPVQVPLASLYRYNEDGTVYNPSSTDDVLIVYAQAEDYSDFNVLRRLYIIALGEVLAYDPAFLSVSFTRMGATRLYNQYNPIRAGTIVYDASLGATFYVLQNVPRPQSQAEVIPITNGQYFQPLKDYSPMAPGTVFANFEAVEGAGNAYPVDRTRLELIKLGSGYGDYISFKTATIPTAIANATDWDANIDLWVTDGYQFTSLDALLTYLANFGYAERFKVSNNGTVRTEYQSGSITITPIFTPQTLEGTFDTIYQPILDSTASGQFSAYGGSGVLAPSGYTPTSFATSAQGAKADTAVQVVTLSQSPTRGSVVLTVDGIATTVAVPGLGTAAFQPDTAFATAAQGLLADSAIQSVTLESGLINGTLRIVVDGTPGSDIAVTGLGTAAYQNIAAFATAAQGILADSALQTITFATGTTNGTFLVSTNGGPQQAVAIGGLGSAAYQDVAAFATAAQGTLATTALQRSDVVDSTSSTAVDLPGSANQLRLLRQRIDSITGSGRPIGGFPTYAERYTNSSQYASDLQPIVQGDEIYILQDENHTDQPTRYRVASVDSVTGDIVYSFLGIDANLDRDFVVRPIQSNELADGAVGTAHLQNSSVTTPKLANGAVVLSKLDTTVQSSLAKADTSLQSPISTSGNGPFVSQVRKATSSNVLEVVLSNLSQLISTSVTGGGSFLSGVTLATNQLEFLRDGIAVQTVQFTGTGDVLTGVSVTGNVMTFQRGVAFPGLTISGTGNAIVNATTDGVLTKGTLIATVAKSGTGNVLTGVSTDIGGNATFTSGDAFTSLVVSGSGNFVTGLSSSGGVLTVTLGTALTSVPDASTTAKGIVQLNNTLTSTSTTLALTAAQGKVLKDLIDQIPNNYVALTGNQTIYDIKTFISHPAVPAKTTLPTTPLSTQYATESQVATRAAKLNVFTTDNLIAFSSSGDLRDTGINYQTLDTAAITNAEIDNLVNSIWP